MKHEFLQFTVLAFLCSLNLEAPLGAQPERGRLARVVSELGFGEFRRQLEYRTELSKTQMIAAGRWFRPRKLCRRCGLVNESMAFDERTFPCNGCKHVADRSIHAARKLERYPGLIGETDAA